MNDLSTERISLASWTPTKYDGVYPPYVSVELVGAEIQITVRKPDKEYGRVGDVQTFKVPIACKCGHALEKHSTNLLSCSASEWDGYSSYNYCRCDGFALRFSTEVPELQQQNPDLGALAHKLAWLASETLGQYRDDLNAAAQIIGTLHESQQNDARMVARLLISSSDEALVHANDLRSMANDIREVAIGQDGLTEDDADSLEAIACWIMEGCPIGEAESEVSVLDSHEQTQEGK